VVHGHLGGLPPKVDLEAERQLAQVLVAASRGSLVTAAHDVSDGGIAQVLVEMALRENVGATLTAPADIEPFVFLIAESTARAVVTADPRHVDALVELARGHGVPISRIGVVTGPGDDLQVDLVVGESLLWTLDELRATADATLPALFG
jgi:phosphoribosylformylglycinamidine synthase